ncbi:MAG: hypothetical protein ACREMM_02230 [Gemmatimonadales bacterium]
MLYFDNLSRDTADAYLADGLTDEIIARLGQVERLQVKSRTAVARYRDATLDPGQLGRTLGVAYLVNGTVRRGARRLRVTVELVRASSGNRLWGQQYDRTDADLLAIEEDIAKSVVTAIAGRLAPAERASLAARPTRNLAAYDHYLRGNYYLAQRRSAAVSRAIEEHGAAVALDSTFAEAQARIALGYALSLDWSWTPTGLTPDSLLARGLAAADRALRRDSLSSDAWMARAYLLRFRYPQTYAGVLAAFERAMARDPRNAEAVHQYGSALTELGDDSGAVAAFHQALALEAERPVTLFQLALVSKVRRQYAEASQWLDSALAIDPGFPAARSHRAVLRARLGDRAGAVADLQLAQQIDPSYADRFQAVVAGLLGDSVGARAAAQRLLGEIARADSPTALRGAVVGSALVAAGEPARAFDILERVRPRGVYFWWLLRYHEFDPVRADPRFLRLVEESRPR